MKEIIKHIKYILPTIIILTVFLSFVDYYIKEQKYKYIEEHTPKVIEIEHKVEPIEVVKETVETGIEVKKVEEELQPILYLSEYERQVVECIVMGESEGEPYDGQIAVAQCIINACLKDDLKPSEVRKKYKYSGWKDNPSESVKTAVTEVFDNGTTITDEFILYFYAPKYCKSNWHETQHFVVQIGGHRFFAEK